VLNLDGPDFMYKFESFEEYEVTLDKDNRAYSDKLGSGTWTMVYDEGFIIEFPSHDLNLFNYFMYAVGDWPGKYLSVCDKTMKGWSRSVNSHSSKEWNCWFGFKDYVPTEGSKEVAETHTNDFRWVQPIEYLQVDSKF
jgi:hypothetical protein